MCLCVNCDRQGKAACTSVIGHECVIGWVAYTSLINTDRVRKISVFPGVILYLPCNTVVNGKETGKGLRLSF